MKKLICGKENLPWQESSDYLKRGCLPCSQVTESKSTCCFLISTDDVISLQNLQLHQEV